MGLIDFLIRNRAEALALVLQHLFLVASGTGAGICIGIPIGIFLTRKPGLSKLVLGMANVLQTIPSLALFGFLIPLLGTHGIGQVPAVIALFIYSLLPIIQNTFTGIRGVEPAVREAALGMGMTDWQILVQVELPLSLSVILAGVRVATVISVGTATIAAAIGAGGLGTYIFRGLRMNDNQLILAGALPAALMALAADFMLGRLESILKFHRSSGKNPSRKWVPALVMVGIILIGFLTLSRVTRIPPIHRIVVGSKDFTEQVILGELIARQIERRTGLDVERRFELGGDLCHRALLAGEIDIYVEYTGTAFAAILKHQPIADPGAVYVQVKREYLERFGLVWLAPLGFNNTFAILVRGDEAQRLSLRKISDISRYAPRWRAGFGQDFMSRPDGYPGFSRTYDLKFVEPPREMDLSLTYRALANGQVDVIAGNSTDGAIELLGLVALQDDRQYFPPYQAAPVVRKGIVERYPQVAGALNSLGGTVSDHEMRRLNYQVDSEHRDVKQVVNEFLEGK
ncbi:MAG: ABC transporter permease subunit [Acidobacteriia bacterium]|nr:ABC transporter permease subunit [Terriglobia bacterium]